MTLAADPSTPIYACGSTPNRMRCVPTITPDFTAARNVVAPTAADMLALGDLVAVYLGSRPAAPVIGICTWPGCDAAAVDGRCLTHG
jgi:hypothetical protein